MTLTASPTSTAVDRAAFGDLAPAETWFTTVDHRQVGGLLTAAAAAVGVIGTVLLGLVSQKYLSYLSGTLSNGDVLGSSPDAGFSYDRIANMVRTGLPYFVVIPLFLGIATVVVPGQIGAKRLAFPRLQAFVLWGYIAAAATFIASFAIGDGPPLVNLSELIGSNPAGRGNRATDLLLASLMLVTIVSILGALNLVVTIATQRATGRRLSDVRPFSFAALVTSGILLIASPVFLAGLALVEMDQHYGISIFNSDGGQVFWAHLIALVGRPEGLLLLVPALGAMVDVASARVGASPLGGRAANTLLGVAGGLTLLAWAAGPWRLDHLVQPNSTWQTSLIGIPIGLLTLVTLGTLGANRASLKPDASLLAALGVDLLVTLAVVNIVIAAIRGVGTDAFALWQKSQIPLVTVAIPILGLLAAGLEFAPRAVGRRAHAATASLGVLGVLGGFAVGLGALAAIAYRDDALRPAKALSAVAAVALIVAGGGLALAAASMFGTTRGAAAPGPEAGN